MDAYTLIVALIVVLLLLVITLFWLADMLSFYSDRLAKLQEENSCFRQLVQEKFLLDNDSMAAFNRMFSAACLHGFEDGSIVDEDA